MKVDLRMLRPNPTRDFTIDPLDPESIAKLKPSITEYGWWGGVVCRVLPDGTYEIAAGHHRIQAAVELGMTEADIVVRKDISDKDMIRIYATENATQRGNSTTSVAGSVASALRFCSKELLLGRYPVDMGSEEVSTIVDTSKYFGHAQAALLSDEGIGERLLLRFLNNIPGVSLRSIREQLANLKESGNYARIISEVEQGVAEEHRQAQEAEEAAERDRQQRLKEELEAQTRRLEAEQRAAEAREAARQAREEAVRQRQERQAQEAEQAQQRAQVKAEQATQRRRDAEAVHAKAEAERRKKDEEHAKAQEAKTTAAKRKRIFDFEGVAAVFKNDYQVAAFREVVTGPGIQPYLPVEHQAELAKQLMAYAQQCSTATKTVEMTATFIRDNVVTLFLGVKAQERAETHAEHEALLRADRYQRAEHLQEEFCRYARAMVGAAKRIETLQETWPKDEPFPWTPKLSRTVQSIKKAIDDLTEHGSQDGSRRLQLETPNMKGA